MNIISYFLPCMDFASHVFASISNLYSALAAFSYYKLFNIVLKWLWIRHTFVVHIIIKHINNNLLLALTALSLRLCSFPSGSLFVAYVQFNCIDCLQLVRFYDQNCMQRVFYILCTQWRSYSHIDCFDLQSMLPFDSFSLTSNHIIIAKKSKQNKT